jgi:hypothetical protein
VQPAPRQLSIATRVVPPLLLARVTTAIQLDHEPRRRAVEVHDGARDRVLAAKPHAQLLAPQPAPQPFLRVRRPLSQGPCVFDQLSQAAQISAAL